MTDVMGIAQCVTPGCEDFGTFQEIPMVETTMTERASDLPVTITENTYRHLQDDADLPCPACGLPRALMAELPRNYPKMIA